ncbi:hypothetical protein H8B15_03445 [Hymenobacter sp. BT507]|uniref:DUF4136 domain-containing protein n=1 Tax=Hymenobacter citatus TaxID=2763506 RepID=A0ABR7MFX7_9BACT|nr:hypothetical protein [Hymenobacter citatus]MBC6609960.1 hypothetical protein [Hymenobacter citatus]
MKRFAPFLVFLVSWLWQVSAQAQQQGLVQQFTDSSILLTTGDTLEGPLTLNRREDVVQIQLADGSVRTLSAIAVQSFAVKGEQIDRRRNPYYYDDFYDARAGYYYGNPFYSTRPLRRRQERPDTSLVRVFQVYRWNRDNDYSDFKSPGFFEQLSNGPTVLLRRESLVQRAATYGSPYGYGAYRGGYPYGAGIPPTQFYTDIKDDFYLGFPDGRIIALRNPKKDLLNTFHQQQRQIEAYAKINHLDYTNARELAYIVNYVNSLHSAVR